MCHTLRRTERELSEASLTSNNATKLALVIERRQTMETKLNKACSVLQILLGIHTYTYTSIFVGSLIVCCMCDYVSFFSQRIILISHS
jgi:hypothetical protein